MSSTRTDLATDHTTRVRWVAGVLLLALAVLVGVLLTGGGAPESAPEGLSDPGPVSGWGLPVVRLLSDLAGLTTLGLLLAAAFLLPSPARVLTRPGFGGTQLAVRVALLWAVLVLVQVVLSASDYLAVPPQDALDSTLLRGFTTQIPQGRALVAQLVLALVVAGVARSVVTSSRAVLATALAVAALIPPALAGHSASAGQHDLAVASLMVHVVLASLWVGGLLALLRLAVLPGRPDEARSDQHALTLALARFSVLAGVCWVGVGVSGLVNASVRLGPADILGTSYGVLVLFKLLALLVLGGFGWWHRRHTVDQLRRNASGTLPAFVRVAAVELVVMGATYALAVGLSRTPTPEADLTDTSRATELLGFPLPPPPDASGLLLGTTHSGFMLTFLLVAALGYAVGVRTVWLRGDAWPVGRVLAWYAGILVAGWASIGGLGLYAHVLFSAHMVSHMLLSMVAPIGLVLGAPVTLALRALPGRRTPEERGLRQLLQHVLDSRVVQVISNPLVAAALFVVSLYALYFTSLFGVLMENHLGHALMELHFLAVGSLFFWVLVGIDPTPRRWHPFARIGLVLVVVSFHAFFSIALMNTDYVLAGDYYRSLDRPYSTDLLADQSYGAGLAWGLGEIPVVMVLAAIFVQWVRSDRREAQRIDQRADRRTKHGEDEHEAYNAYLARLSGQRPPGGEDE